MDNSCSDIHALPENCIAHILSLTSPVDAYRLSAVATIFLSASEADAVWESFLPSNYREIISRASPDSPLNNLHSKKALYIYLSDNPILIDDGGKSFWLEKRSGKKCCRVSSRNLWVVWTHEPGYWGWVSRPESRFKEVAELLKVWWLEIKCCLHLSMLSPGIEYAAYCLYTTNSAFHGLADQPIEILVQVDGQEGNNNTVSLVPLDGSRREWYDGPVPSINPLDDEKNHPKQRDDGWIEVEMGEF